MIVTVKQLSGVSHDFEIERSTLVEGLMEMVEAVWSIPVSRQRLIWGGKQLDAWKTLSDYDVSHHCTIHFDVRRTTQYGTHLATGLLIPKRPVQVRLPDGKRLSIEIEESATVQDLKTAIGHEASLDPWQVRLLCGGRVLVGGNTPVSSYVEHHEVKVEALTSGPFRVFLLLPDATRLPIDVIHTDIVHELKRTIERKTGVPHHRQRLWQGEHELYDANMMLADCKVDPGSTLRVGYIEGQKPANNSTQVALRYEDDSRPLELVRVDCTELVSSFKARIAEQKSVPPERIKFSFKGEVLDDNRQLATYNIRVGCIVSCKGTGESDVQVTIKGPTLGNDGLVVSVRSSFTVSELKEHIAGRPGIPSDTEQFFLTTPYKGVVLRDDLSIGLADLANVDLLVRDTSLVAPEATSTQDSCGSSVLLVAATVASPEARTEAERFATVFEPSTLQLHTVPIDVEVETNTKDSSPAPPMIPEDDTRQLPSSSTVVPKEDGVENSPFHLLSDKAAELLNGGSWKSLLPLLPESIRWDLRYEAHLHRPPCWTLTPSVILSPDDVPLCIAGAPVVVPVDFRYPLAGAVMPPPDPYQQPINPSASIRMETIMEIFQTFDDAAGFFLLLNGMLQIVVPPRFDYAWASSHKPNFFGGLRVCYLGQSFQPTAQVTQSQQIDTSTVGMMNIAYSVRSLFAAQKSATIIPGFSLRMNHIIEARVKDSKSTNRHAGKVGLRIRDERSSKEFVTMSSHVVTDALLARSKGSLVRRIIGGSQMTLNRDWVSAADIYASDTSVKIGGLAETFDPDAQEYPSGFKYDVSLIEPSDPNLVVDLKSPVTGLGWLSREGWNNLRRGNHHPQILGGEDRKAKSIASLHASECLIVGTGVFINRKATNSIPPNQTAEQEKERWKTFVSQSLLYRVAPDFEIPNGQSGLAIYADGLREDGTTGPGVAGFQSFVQLSGHEQTFAMEGDALNYRLSKGLVAFYGAFEVPDKLKSYSIL